MHWLSWFAVLLAIPTATCEDKVSTAAGVFVYDHDAGPPLVFALNAVDNGDLYFHMSGSASPSYMAIGIGEDMDGSLMFIVYKSGNGTSLTLSPRVAFNGESEPSYYPVISCEQFGAQVSDQLVELDAVCHNATSWPGGSIDLGSTSQPFMFAFGPDTRMRSDSLSAAMLRHALYGNFDIDMTRATSKGEGAVPAPNGADNSYVATGTSDADGVKTDNDALSIVHGIVMCLAYILVYPVGALLLRLAKRIPVRLHIICQCLGSLLVLVGFAMGVYTSKQYNRSRNFSDSYQIIGIVLFIAVIVQLSLGEVHHLIYKKKGKATLLSKVHLVFGPLIIIVAVVNGGLGIDLALVSSGGIIAYSVAVLVFAIVVLCIRTWYEFNIRRQTMPFQNRGVGFDHYAGDSSRSVELGAQIGNSRSALVHP